MKRSVLLMVAALVLPSCGDDAPSTPSTPSNPSTPTGTTPPTTQPPANRPPTVMVFDVQPKGTVLAGGTQVSFGARGTDPDGDPLTFEWDFGDGEKATGGGVVHIYYREGEQRASVTARDNKGGSATSEFYYLNVRRLTGTWRVNNARKIPLTATIEQSNGGGLQGRLSDGSTFSGVPRDPRNVTLFYNSVGTCMESGTYNGAVDGSINSMTFVGVNCAGWSMDRQ